jgi:uncharacterized membrane protein YbhN (UPF0104 family)
MFDLIHNLQFLITSGILLASLALVGFLIWQEKRPRKNLMPGLLPTTPILMLAAIVFLLTAVHLVHIVAPGALPPPQQ